MNRYASGSLTATVTGTPRADGGAAGKDDPDTGAGAVAGSDE